MDWKPIETAPIDEEIILGRPVHHFGPEDNGEVSVGSLEDCLGKIWDSLEEGYRIKGAFTVWQPLPQPPTN
jgi:hypothetical protein